MILPIPDLGTFLFFGIALLTIASALMVVTSPNLVHSAVSLLFTLFSIAAIYVFLYADFIAATQVVVYVGGILVLIIFGVMLTNKIDDPEIGSSSRNQFFASFGATFILSILLTVIMRTEWKSGEMTSRDETVKDIGHLLRTELESKVE